MKKLFYSLTFAALCLVSCNDDSGLFNLMLDTDQRIAHLEELCSELNTNITSLQVIVEAQQSGDYITNITPIMKDGQQIGYTITFAKHPAITIYNGENGKDGVNGKNGINGQDGKTPVLGAVKDTDGIYYWTINGSWLLDSDGHKIRVTGEKGEKGDKGNTGATGQNGTNGKNGTDGVTPQLKIQDDYWYISYDNGSTWTQLGKAKGDKGDKGATGAAGTNGTNGKDGQDGDSMFKSVTYDENKVYFTLTNGTVLQVPISGGSGNHKPSDIIEFKDLNVKSALLSIDGVDSNLDGEISYGEAKFYQGTISMYSNADILSFTELKYFEGLDSIRFARCSKLFEVELPDNLTRISNSAFAETQISTIRIPDSCVAIGNDAFLRCTNLRYIQWNEILQYIGKDAFNGTALKNINLPNSVTTIGLHAFNGSSLESFSFPKNLKEGMLAYSRGSSKKITIYWNCINYTGTHKWDYYSGLAQYNSNSSTSSSMSISNVYFGDNVQTIPAYLCYHCEKITSIELPNSVTNIGSYAFGDCPEIAEITLGTGLLIISNNAFYGAKKITTITLESNVQQIGNSAFGGCTNLYLVYSKNPVPPTLGTGVFSNTKIGLIYVPMASVAMYQAAWSDYADKIVGYNFE